MTLYGTKPAGHKSLAERITSGMDKFLTNVGAGGVGLVLVGLMALYIVYTMFAVLTLQHHNNVLYDKNAALQRQIALIQHGDLNADGKVDNTDLAIMYSGWSAKVPLLVGDLNHDGTIDDKDATILFNHWSDRSQTPALNTRSS